MMKYHGYHIKAKEMIGNGRLGQIVMGRAHLTCWYPPVEDSGVILLGFENQAYGVCDSFFNIPDEAAKGVLELYGTKGSLMAEVEDFIDAVEKNRRPMNSSRRKL